MTYANMANVPTQVAGSSPVLASDWNTYVKDNFADLKFGHIVCTSSTRPSTGLAEGVMIYETDTNKLLVYSGTSWIEVIDLDRAGALPETSPGHLIVADNTAKSALTATEGMMVYQSDNNKVFVYSGSAWVEVSDLDNSGAISDTNPGHRIVADNTAKTALGNVAEGFMVYQSDVDKFFVNSNGTTANWVEVGGVKTPSGATTQSINIRPPYASVARSTTSLPSGLGTLLSFDSGSTNDGMFTATSTNITIKTPGVYLVTAYADFGAQAGGVRYLIPKVNGSAFTGTSRTSTGGVINDLLNVSSIYAFNLSDVITFEVVQNSGVGIGIAANAQVAYLGASS